MNKEQERIKKLMDSDPLSTAEKITGKNYKIDKATEGLGVFLHIQKSKILNEELSKQDDTLFSETTEEYIRKIKAFGFIKFYEEPFYQEDGKEETMQMYFLQELGILLCMDTHYGHRNSANIYYNWSPNYELDGFSGNITSTGGFMFFENPKHMALYDSDLLTPYTLSDYPESIRWDSPNEEWETYCNKSDKVREEQTELIKLALSCGKRRLWSGNHDAREGVKNKIKSLYENGKFFPIWHESPFPWLTHYREHKNLKEDFKILQERCRQATLKRIALFSEEVKTCINNTYPYKTN